MKVFIWLCCVGLLYAILMAGWQGYRECQIDIAAERAVKMGWAKFDTDGQEAGFYWKTGEEFKISEAFENTDISELKREAVALGHARWETNGRQINFVWNDK
jgi:hypothetical protein